MHVLRDGADDVNFGLDITGVQVPIEGGEHVSIFTHRDEVRARVTRFLREHAPKPPPPLGEPDAHRNGGRSLITH